jgi:hypothetical protein
MANYEWNGAENEMAKYLASCQKAADNDIFFASFKKDKDYCHMLEHVSYEIGEYFIDNMKNIDSLTPEKIKKFKENDFYGFANLQEYKEFGMISPSTVRYVKNTLDILNFLKNKEVNTIVEIGGGYGGLCKTLSALINFTEYTLIDLPEANNLSKKYLNKFNDTFGKVNQVSCFEFEPIDSIDLFISNYAFSECSLKIQKDYYEKVIINAKNFYIIYNNIYENNLTHEEFIKLAEKNFDILVEEEIIPNHRNYILYGTKK